MAMDGDTIVVTAPYDNGNDKDGGSVYVFTRNGTKWKEQMKLLPHDATSGNMFGKAVALDGDIKVVSARGDDENESSTNYVFIRNGDTWNELDKFHLLDMGLHWMATLLLSLLMGPMTMVLQVA